jgi:hypothetical protein
MNSFVHESYFVFNANGKEMNLLKKVTTTDQFIIYIQKETYYVIV